MNKPIGHLPDKDNRNLNAPEPPEPPEKKKPIEMDWVCPECFSNVRCDCA